MNGLEVLDIEEKRGIIARSARCGEHTDKLHKSVHCRHFGNRVDHRQLFVCISRDNVLKDTRKTAESRVYSRALVRGKRFPVLKADCEHNQTASVEKILKLERED